MRLRAKVIGTSGKASHHIGTLVESTPTSVRQLPVPACVEIAEEGGAFYLFHLDAEGVCFADTWHQTLDDAKRQAAFEFGIKPDEWTDVVPPCQ